MDGLIIPELIYFYQNQKILIGTKESIYFEKTSFLSKFFLKQATDRIQSYTLIFRHTGQVQQNFYLYVTEIKKSNTKKRSCLGMRKKE